MVSIIPSRKRLEVVSPVFPAQHSVRDYSFPGLSIAYHETRKGFSVQMVTIVNGRKLSSSWEGPSEWVHYLKLHLSSGVASKGWELHFREIGQGRAVLLLRFARGR